MLFKHLLTYAAETLVKVGASIHDAIVGDGRLADADAALAPAQQSLVEKVDAWKRAYIDARAARSYRRTSVRALRSVIRDFAFGCLTLTDNHHGRAPYVRYFPEGYGIMKRLQPAALITFAGIILEKLTDETEPTLHTYEERIQTARASCQAVEADYLAKVEAREASFELMDAEKLPWIQALSDSWSRATKACFDQRSYLRDLYVPAFPQRRNGHRAEPDDGGDSAEGVPDTSDPVVPL